MVGQSRHPSPDFCHKSY